MKLSPSGLPTSSTSSTSSTFPAVRAFPFLRIIGAAMLLAMLLAMPPALSAQLVEFPVQVEVGAEFQRVVSATTRTESPRGSGFAETRFNVRFRIAEVHENGSGTLEVTIDSMWTRSESPRTGLVEWNSTTDPVVTDDPALALTGGLVGRSLSFPLLAGGMVDPAPFMEERESDAETLELWTLVMLVGPHDRADGLHAGFPASLRMSTPQSVPTPFSSGVGGHLTYTLAEPEGPEGRQMARVEISGEGAIQEGRSTLTGHVLFDLDTGRMVEEVRVAEQLRGSEGNSVSNVTETRTERVR